MTSHHFNIETIGIVGTGGAGARDKLADTFAIFAAKGKPANRRYRPSPWLAHRAQPGVALTRPAAADIHEPNEARA